MQRCSTCFNSAGLCHAKNFFVYVNNLSGVKPIQVLCFIKDSISWQANALLIGKKKTFELQKGFIIRLISTMCCSWKIK